MVIVDKGQFITSDRADELHRLWLDLGMLSALSDRADELRRLWLDLGILSALSLGGLWRWRPAQRLQSQGRFARFKLAWVCLM